MGQEFQCGFCKDGTLENLATCTSCNSLHHNECFEESKQCTTYACGGKSATAVTAEDGISETTTYIAASVESRILANHEPRMARIAEVTARASQSRFRDTAPWYQRPLSWVENLTCLVSGPIIAAISGSSAYVSGLDENHIFASALTGLIAGLSGSSTYWGFRKSQSTPRVSQYDV